jgi:hypothetical protein
MATASKSIPFVVPAQPSPKIETISQAELTLLLSLRGWLQLESQVETAEQSIKEWPEQNGSFFAVRASASDFSATVAPKKPNENGPFRAVLVSQPKEEAQR